MPAFQNLYALLLEYRYAEDGTHGTYRYGDAAGLLRDWGTFKVRALPANKGRDGFTVTCRSERPAAKKEG